MVQRRAFTGGFVSGASEGAVDSLKQLSEQQKGLKDARKAIFEAVTEGDIELVKSGQERPGDLDLSKFFPNVQGTARIKKKEEKTSFADVKGGLLSNILGASRSLTAAESIPESELRPFAEEQIEAQFGGARATQPGAAVPVGTFQEAIAGLRERLTSGPRKELETLKGEANLARDLGLLRAPSVQERELQLRREARDAIAKGADPSAVAQRLQEQLGQF